VHIKSTHAVQVQFALCAYQLLVGEAGLEISVAYYCNAMLTTFL
jgi:hypothetical protein